MGAAEFFTTAYGTSPEAAFRRAKEDAYYEFGHGGYTGSIAEKHTFRPIRLAGADPTTSLPSRDEAMAHAQKLINEDDKRISDKWGPAGCIEFDNAAKTPMRGFLFFGIASE